MILERGVAAGERALGRRVFREEVGDFWLIFETRPYMRELMRLNPRDNQMLRSRHAHWLLELEAYNELEGPVRGLRRGPRARIRLHAGARRVPLPGGR